MILRPCGFPSNSLKSVINSSSNSSFLFFLRFFGICSKFFGICSKFFGIYSNMFFAHSLIAASPK